MSDQAAQDFAAVRVTHAATGASIVVHPHGATLLSWMPAPAPPSLVPSPSGNGKEVPLDDGEKVVVGGTGDVLFVSSDTVLREDKAIRGGVPIAFPQFAGEGSLPNHGFARTSRWTVAEKGDGMIVLTLEDNPRTRAVWGHAFKLELRIEFDDAKCHSTLTVHNTGDAPIEPQALLHTYYRVQNINVVYVEGLTGLTYEDKVQDFKSFELKDKHLTIKGETDKIFRSAAPQGKATFTLDAGSGMWRHISLWAEAGPGDGSGDDASATMKPVPCDAVVWNPWEDKAKAMGDFGDNEFNNMICVEPGCVRNKPTIPPGHRFALHQEISLE
ncbi:hypothetical protein PTSG_07295 [Salpingoeca rosetta]|uniref:glucose-6-phosphate 1-epimerase n=1 Tax=Salpingoeca rosetta (strain ATCC 50818 / BSB-021) TaxID=946362 RepID=F2UJ06_SALR5|nr:uncharacterized protein PTSG_07295 [Salpingoeca rosetta]EGD76954.1 hypothetical protein PTSG_07295 [Salpingoeca rosetta]|eukprot:XP_004990794.1 hypothetical protein PTSG_07295 [Salpingoeca rosetta]